ncbi:polysaccharide pyruvyl transferase family protein [Tautonia sociabilis]|uniref:Polysaccharide pyruvyl transferase family protein n=1 Tax=Tautonia sociabilis TaxID=2080755 RepID=A0A432MIH6_9BACT|nr:polysaccharide pyruvyl transferase family protein [Tautonia sociabilis]RUL87163.1 polysaccharide pyruvyl transferase family protein [Tautonia sociabilis]
MKIYLVNDTSDHPNWGCRATTRALRRMIVEREGEITHTLFLERMDQPERFVTSAAGRLFERAVWKAARQVPGGPRLARAAIFGRLDRLYGVGDSIPRTLAQFRRHARHVMEGRCCRPEREALEACDLVLINGEGSIYDRQRKGLMMLFLAYLAKEHFGKPCALVNHTADLSDPATFEIAAAVYPRLDDVTFREPVSAEHCQPILPDATSRIAPDAAFTYEPADREAWAALAGRPGYLSVWPDSADDFDPSLPYVCVGGSSIYFRPDRPSYDPVPAYRALCLRLRSEFGQVVLFAPDGPDVRLLRPLARSLGLPMVGLHTPTQQAVDLLGNAALCISGRFHPSILSLTGGTPIILTTANTHKTAGLLRLIGSEAQPFDALRLGEQLDDVLALARDLVAQGPALRRSLQRRARGLAEAAWRNVSSLEGSGRRVDPGSDLSGGEPGPDPIGRPEAEACR